ncbi:MAG: glycosyltransferase [Kiritimatiellia bacterium]
MISIVMPLYNAEATIRQTIESIRQQTFSDWECICVDDGSIDDSWNILKHYSAEDNRFICLQQQNAGPSAARNAALQKVRGDWLMFVDADDLLALRTLELSLKVAEDERVDAVIFAYEIIPWESTAESMAWLNASLAMTSSPETFCSTTPVKTVFSQANLRSVWGKLYRMDCVRDVRFDIDQVPGREDMLWLCEATTKLQRLSVMPQKFYGYRVGERSVTRRAITVDYLLWHLRSEAKVGRFLVEQGKRSSEWKEVKDAYQNVIFTENLKWLFQKTKELRKKDLADFRSSLREMVKAKLFQPQYLSISKRFLVMMFLLGWDAPLWRRYRG